jgi:hypothetical protein
MAKEFQLYVFEFEGTAETIPSPSNKPQPVSDMGAVSKLNMKSKEIAENIEKEIARFFRSSASVQAEVRFYEGSIIIEGTLLIMSWLGPIALTAGVKAFEIAFARVVEVAIQRVLQRVLLDNNIVAEPIRKVDVRSQAITPQLEEPESKPAREQLPGARSNMFGNRPTLMSINTVLLLIILALQMTLAITQLTP